jgi:tetratricopeptide (TPR) repeat protein
LFPLSAVVLLVGLWWGRRWVGRGPVAALVYFAVAFPALVLVQVLYMMRFTFVTDHWQYLGSMGVIALGVGGVVRASEWWGHGSQRLGPVVGTVVLGVLGLLTWRQGCIYHDVETLWGDTLAQNPNAWIAHNNLGMALWQAGRIEGVTGHFEQALRLKPDYAEAHNNLGVTLEQAGKIKEAIGHFEQALRIKPDYAEAHNNLGIALLKEDRVQEAVGRFKQALRIKPDCAEAHYNLGLALVRLGRLQEAMGHWEQALRLKSDFAEAHHNLGVALEQAGRVQEAIGHYEMALRIKPDLAEPQKKLARLRAAQ